MQRRRVSAMSQRGVGALVVVMMLFFIMSLVAAYASRNLIFEQKTSANNYRATQAFEAADAGLEWAIAMLNGGRINAMCTPPNPLDTTLSNFRDRYLSINNTGISVTGLRASCVRGTAGWSCSCPTAGAPVLTAPGGTAATPTFDVRFFAMSPPAQPVVVRIEVTGCSNYGATPCSDLLSTPDARAEVNAVVGLGPSLTRVPVAALTVRNNLVAANARIYNPVGVVINIGGLATSSILPPEANLRGPAGSTPRVDSNDPSLQPVTAAGGMNQGQMMFLAHFGMAPDKYRTLPAVVRISCGVECGAQLQLAADLHPGRVIWVDGPLNVNTAATLGSVAAPVILVLDGGVTIGSAGNLSVNGLVYSRAAQWDNGTGTTLMRGAFIAEGDANGDFRILGEPSIAFDVDIVDRLKLAQARQIPDFGSIARVPGSWRSF